jgi:hypothetical protein
VTLIAFFAVCAGGAALAQLTRPFRRLGPVVGLASLAAACATALLIGPTDGVTAGDVRLAGSTYAGTFLAAATAATLLLCVVGLASGWPDRLVPAALAAFGGLGVALTATDPRVALAAAAAAAASGAVVSVRSGPAGEEPDNRLSEARTLALLVASLLFAATAVSRPSWASGDGPVFVLGFLGLGTALAIRSGAIPFHLPAARLGKHGASMAPALLLVWIPAGIGLMAVSWSATTFGSRNDWLDAAATVVGIVAVATLVLGAVGALLHDDLTEVVVYSIVQDSAFILLALASRDAGAAEPARMWLLAFVAAKTAFVAWAAAASSAFGSPDLGKLRGWLRRAPILGLALVAIAVATLGWPGSSVFEARSTLIDLALPDRLHLLGGVAIVLSLGYYGRLLLVGLLSPTDAVKAAAGERPRWSPTRGGTTAAAEATAEAEATAAAEAAAEAAATAEAEATAALKPKRKTGRAVAAAELVPAKTAPLAAAAQADAATASASPPAGSGWRDRLLSVWSLNRTLEVSGAVLAAAALALTLAFGGLGASNASRGGIPFDTAAHATSTPSPSPTPSPTPSPEPTFAPIATHELGPSASPSSSAPPTGSPAPTRSSKPNPVPKG